VKLNHLNLTVSDVVEAAQFLKTYFGLRSERENKNLTILFDDAGLVLTLMRAGWPPTPRGATPGLDADGSGETSTTTDQPPEVKYPGNFHIGFVQESEERVNEINRRLKADGFAVDPPQRSHAWTFYVQAPGGFMVEVLA